MDGTIIIKYLPLLLQSCGLTIALVIGALCIGIVFSITLTLLSDVTGWRLLRWSVNLYSFIFRGTPSLVQIFIIYYGVAQLSFIQNSILWVAFKEPIFCVILALGLNTTAYTLMILRGSINAIPKGEIEAGKAMGMSQWMLYRRLILPRALRLVLPSYSNEAVMVLKTTALASAVTLTELTNMTQRLAAQTYMVIEFYLIACGLYLLLNTILLVGFKYLEKRYTSYAK